RNTLRVVALSRSHASRNACFSLIARSVLVDAEICLAAPRLRSPPQLLYCTNTLEREPSRVSRYRSAQCHSAVRADCRARPTRDLKRHAEPRLPASIGPAARGRAAHQSRHRHAGLPRSRRAGVRRDPAWGRHVRPRSGAGPPGAGALAASGRTGAQAARRGASLRCVVGGAAACGRKRAGSKDHMNDAIQLERLRYRAGKAFEIKDLDLHVPMGSIYGFLGPNGSGKTTTIRLILGLVRALAGRITVLGGQMPQDYARVLSRVGYVPEQPHLDPTLTVRELIDFQSAFYERWDRVRAAE